VHLSGFIKKNTYQRITYIVLLFLFIRTSYAIDLNISVEIERLPNPNTETILNLDFYVADTLRRDITAKCYKKGPTEFSFVQFDGEKKLSEGGGRNHCVVEPRLLSDDGTYSFYVTASAGGDVNRSDIVTIHHEPEYPGVPKELIKEINEDCGNKVSFKTANDGGDTTQVDVFRSVNKVFKANSGTRILDIDVSSNSLVEFTDNSTKCDLVYYYGVIALDDLGNKSEPLAETDGSIVTIEESIEGESVFGSMQRDKSSTFGSLLARQEDGEDSDKVLGERDDQVHGADNQTDEQTTIPLDKVTITDLETGEKTEPTNDLAAQRVTDEALTNKEPQENSNFINFLIILLVVFGLVLIFYARLSRRRPNN
jgi:hypothetical protein